MFQMLAEMVGAEEFLGLIAFAELMHLGKMAAAGFPVRVWKVFEFGTAIAADVCVGEGIWGGELAAGIVWEDGGGGVECTLEVVGQSSA